MKFFEPFEPWENKVPKKSLEDAAKNSTTMIQYIQNISKKVNEAYNSLPPSFFEDSENAEIVEFEDRFNSNQSKQDSEMPPLTNPIVTKKTHKANNKKL